MAKGPKQAPAWERISTEMLLSDAFRSFGGTRNTPRTPAQAAELTVLRGYHSLWNAPGPLSEEAEAKDGEIREYCIKILMRKYA